MIKMRVTYLFVVLEPLGCNSRNSIILMSLAGRDAS